MLQIMAKWDIDSSLEVGFAWSVEKELCRTNI